MSFIEEFQQLLLISPRYNLKQVMSENCEYADTALKSNNCYYSFGTFYCDNVLYGRYSRKCTDCCEIALCVECELCVHCTDCASCYDCTQCQNCSNCSEVLFSSDCYSCKNCFGCVGLYQKQYHIFNLEVTSEEYEKRMAEIDFRNPEIVTTVTKQLKKIQETAPRPATHVTQCENCIGNNLVECADCYQCFDTFKSERCLYNIETNGNKDCVDMTVCFECENCYSCVQSPLNYECSFLLHTDSSKYSEFCAFSRELSNCFGCAYIQHKEYHILNKPYSKDDYEKKVAEIKQELLDNQKYDMSLFFASEYEKNRIKNETDKKIWHEVPVI